MREPHAFSQHRLCVRWNQDNAHTRPAMHAARSVYGQSKADAEVELKQILPDCCIVRTSWLFRHRRKCFPDTILNWLKRPQLEVVGDHADLLHTLWIWLAPSFSFAARTLPALCTHQPRRMFLARTRQCDYYRLEVNYIGAGDYQRQICAPSTASKYSFFLPRACRSMEL